jgi:hypothetical protein
MRTCGAIKLEYNAMSRNIPFTGNCLKITGHLYIPEDYRRRASRRCPHRSCDVF